MNTILVKLSVVYLSMLEVEQNTVLYKIREPITIVYDLKLGLTQLYYRLQKIMFLRSNQQNKKIKKTLGNYWAVNHVNKNGLYVFLSIKAYRIKKINILKVRPTRNAMKN